MAKTTHPGIDSYDTASGVRYRARYRKPNGKQTDKRGFKTIRDARLFLASTDVKKAEGHYIDPRRGRITIGELGEKWIATQSHLKPSALRSVKSAWLTHVKPEFELRSVGALEHSEIQQWVSGLVDGIAETDPEKAKSHPWVRKPKGATTVLRAHGVLAGILRVAVTDKRIPSNPADSINLPRKRRGKHAYLTAEQVELLAEEAGDFGGLVLFLAYTGLRWGEATGLLVEDVNFIQRRATVAHNAVMVGSVIEVGTPKGHRQRWIPWPEFLRPYLSDCIKGKTRSAILFGDGINHVRLPNSKDGWFAGAVKRACARDQSMPRITPHDLRHTTASLAVAAGANVKAVQRMLGHASAAMTLDVYADLFDDDLESVADALSIRRGQIVGKGA